MSVDRLSIKPGCRSTSVYKWIDSVADIFHSISSYTGSQKNETRIKAAISRISGILAFKSQIYM